MPSTRPQARYSSAASLATDLRNWLEGEPISVKSPTLFAVIVTRVRRNRGLVYAILVALTGSVLSLPLMLSLLTMWSGQDLYANTQEDPLPALYRLSSIPTWISAGASIVTLLMWPMLGLLVVLVTRPKSLAQAAFSGMVVGAVCGLLFFLAIGWYPISRSSLIASGADISALSEGFWQTDPTQRADLEATLLKRYPLLADIPQESRGGYMRKRIESDCSEDHQFSYSSYFCAGEGRLIVAVRSAKVACVKTKVRAIVLLLLQRYSATFAERKATMPTKV